MPSPPSAIPAGVSDNSDLSSGYWPGLEGVGTCSLPAGNINYYLVTTVRISFFKATAIFLTLGYLVRI